MNTLIQKAVKLGMPEENAKLLYELFGATAFNELLAVKKSMNHASKADEKKMSQRLYEMLKSELGEAFARRVLKLLDTDGDTANNLVKRDDNDGGTKTKTRRAQKVSEQLHDLLIDEYGENLANEAIAVLDNQADETENSDTGNYEADDTGEMDEKAIERFEFWSDYLEATSENIATAKSLKAIRRAEAQQQSKVMTEADFWKSYTDG